MADLHTYKKLPSDPCLTQEQVTAYIDGNLSSAEMHACEKHILDCEMCEDAVEGLALVKDRSVLTAPLKTAEAPTESKVIPLQPTNRRVWYAIAAVLVLVLGTTFMLRMLSSDSDNAMAENKSTAPDIIQSVPGTESTLENDKQANADCLTSAQSQMKSSEAITAEGQTYAEAVSPTDAPKAIAYDRDAEQEDAVEELMAPPVLADDRADGEVARTEVADEKVVLTKEEKQNKKSILEYAKEGFTSGNAQGNTQKDTYFNDNRTTDAVTKPTANAPVPNAAQTTTLGGNNGIDNNNAVDSAGKYDVVLSETTTVADTGTVDQLELSYRNGVTQLNAGQANSAIVLFDKVLANKNHPRYEDAEYQKAKALIKANRKEEAKTLLKAIEAKKGKHAAEATELLKTL